jgi:hypothetical protein
MCDPAAQVSARREVISNNQFDLDLRQKINNVFGPAVEFRVAFLAAISLGLQHGHALYADFLKGFLHFENRRHEGAGLGWAVVRLNAEAMGGAFGVVSRKGEALKAIVRLKAV